MKIQEEQEKNRQLEIKQNSVLVAFLKKKRERLDYADTAQWIAQNQNETDLLLLADSFTEWIGKLKSDDKRKKEFESLLYGIWRISSYCVNLETTCKSAVSMYVTTEKRNNELVSEKRTLEYKLSILNKELEDEIKRLKKEIEFINSK